MEGLIFRLDDQLCQVGPGAQILPFFDLPYLDLSRDGLQGLYVQDNDIWILDVASGGRRNLTNTVDRHECCAEWWSEDRVVFGSWPDTHIPLFGNNFRPVGFPSLINTDGSDYRVLDDTRPYERGFATNPLAQFFIFGPNTFGEAMLVGEEILYSEKDAGRIEVLSNCSVRIIRFETWFRSPAMSPVEDVTVTYSNFEDEAGRYFEQFVLQDPLTEVTQELFAFEVCGRDGPPRPPRWSPDGRFVAFHACAERDDLRGTWVYDLQIQAFIYTPTNNKSIDCVTQLAWHPNSMIFACQHWGRNDPDQYYVVNLFDNSIDAFVLPEDAIVVDWRFVSEQ